MHNISINLNIINDIIIQKLITKANILVNYLLPETLSDIHFVL